MATFEEIRQQLLERKEAGEAPLDIQMQKKEPSKEFQEVRNKLKSTQEKKGILDNINPQIIADGLNLGTLKTGTPEFKQQLQSMKPTEEPTILGGVKAVGKKLLGKATGTFGEESFFAGEEIGDLLGSTAARLLDAPEDKDKFIKLKEDMIANNPEKADMIKKAELDDLVEFPEFKDVAWDLGEAALDIYGEKIISFAGKKLGSGLLKLKNLKKTKELKKTKAVSEAIMPKRTAKVESEALQKQLFKEPKFFQKIFGGKRAIEPTEQLIEDGKIIGDLIDKPKTGNLQEFIKQIGDKGIEIRNKVKPVLKKAEISKEGVDDIVNIGADIEKDVANAFGDLTVADKKAYMKFKDKFIDAKNLDDLWEARIEWDKWITKNVKQAGSGSDAKLLARQDVWLQNRSKINDVISKLAPQEAEFLSSLNQMRALLNAKENIATKGSEFAKIKGIIPQWIKRTVGGTAVAGGSYAVGRKVLGK